MNRFLFPLPRFEGFVTSLAVIVFVLIPVETVGTAQSIVLLMVFEMMQTFFAPGRLGDVFKATFRTVFFRHGC
ncbi:MAG TPA: hypothetical protein DCX78_10005 [Nitrospina sp.]|jgi:hypothetical protein|nr:hypothetical protein [Nitrospinota bacterium]HAX47140.1 hypothetical protein [Nitrospina sp.]